MTEILNGQTLEVDNLLSFRGKIKQADIEFIGRDMRCLSFGCRFI